MLHLKIYTWLLLLSLPIFSKAQEKCSFTLKGRVLDMDTKLPISGTNILLTPGDKTFTTDGHGFFEIPYLCKDDYVLSITSLGFQDKIRHLHLKGNKTLSISLDHDNIRLHDVKVIGHQHQLNTTSLTTSISREELNASKGKALADVLRSTSGVTMLQTGASLSKPVIHGMHSNRILLVNNGIKQEDQQWGSEHAPEIDPFVASTIHIIKGAESVRYGAEAIGGVIRVEPAALPIDPEIRGELDLVGASNGRSSTASARLEGGIKSISGLAWRAQGTFKRSGNMKTADYYLNNTGLQESNYSAALTYRSNFAVIDAYYSHFNTETGIYTGAHIGSLEDLTARIEEGRPFDDGEFTFDIQAPRQKVVHDLVKLKVHKDFINGGQLDLQYGFQKNSRQEYDIRRGDRSNIAALNLVLDAHSLDLTYSNMDAKSLSSTLGINANAIVNNSVPGTYSTPLIPNYDSYGIGVFLIERLIKPTYELEGGLRFDFKTLDAAGYDRNQDLYGGKHAYTNVSGSVGALWRINQQINLRSNFGLAWRPPSVNELYSNGLHHGAASIEIGDENLVSEQGYKWINTFSVEKEVYQIELNAYGHFLKNYIYIKPTGQFDESLRGTFPVFEYTQTDALFYGLDFAGSVMLLKNFQYQAKASLIRAKDKKNNRYFPFIPSDRISHAFRLEGNQTLSFLEKSYLQIEYETVFEQTRYEANADFSPPPGTYSLLNMQAGTSFNVHDREIGISLSGENLLNKLYKEYMNRFRYYAHDKGRNFTLRLSYNF